MAAIQSVARVESLPEHSEGDISLQARKCLSGVARMQGKWGLHMIADVLRGSKRKKVCEYQLDNLSVHGLLAVLTQAKIVALLAALLKAGLILRDEHKCVYLSPLGTAVMLGKRELSEALKSELIEARNAKSDSRPPSERYDPDAWTVKQTLYALQAGRSPRDIAQVRNLSEATICNHIICLAAHGQSFDLTPHLDIRLLDELRQKAPAWKPGDPFTPIRDALDEEECDWTRLKIHLAQIFRE